MSRGWHRVDRAFVVARPVLRKKLGFAGADDVEQCYHCLRHAYKAIDELAPELELELMKAQLSIVQAEQARLQRRDEAVVAAVLRDWRRLMACASTAEAYPQREAGAIGPTNTLCEELDSLDLSLASSRLSYIKEHDNVVQAHTKTVHSLVARVARESGKVKRLLKELDNTAMMACIRLDALRNELLEAVVRAKAQKHFETAARVDSAKSLHHRQLCRSRTAASAPRTDIRSPTTITATTRRDEPVVVTDPRQHTPVAHTVAHTVPCTADRLVISGSAKEQQVNNSPDNADSDPEFVFV